MKTQRPNLFQALLLLLLALMLYGCPEADPEDVPPRVRILSPDDNAYILRGTQVRIEVNAYDPNGSVVSLYIGIDNDDVTHFGIGHGPDYVYTWNTTEVSLGDHRIYALAVDMDNVTDSTDIRVEIYEGNSPPVASFTIDPPSGSINTTFGFDASNSHDNEDPTELLQVRWDWEGDGSWDTQFTTEKAANHQYSQDATYHVKLEVKDSEGLTDVDSLLLLVQETGWNPGEPCPGVPPVTYENRVYTPIIIGEQCWLKENMNVGIMINGNDEPSNNGTIEKYCYANVLAYCDMYGGLYKWDEMMQYVTTEGARGICPPGWHIPTDEEWKQLEGVVDSHYGYPDPQWDGIEFRGYDGGYNVKTTALWANDGDGADLFGFSVAPGGYRGLNGFFYIQESTGYWTSSEAVSIESWFRQLYYYSDQIWRNATTKEAGFSVRCIQD
jgi:uncharacterized protein (TIGR02145 family)